jgi:hypothetical protein
MIQLDDAWEQVRGALEHLDYLRPEIENFRKATLDQASIKREPAIGTLPDGRHERVVRGTFNATFYPTPPRTKRLIGEAVQNLRAALDYLVFQVCCSDSKSVVAKTQLVIADSEQNFIADSKRHFKGMSGEHIAMFQKLQPYTGCEWTGIIRDLSNPSKHEHLTMVQHPVRLSISEGSTDAILAGQMISLESDISMDVAFMNGKAVIDQLEELVTKVTELSSRIRRKVGTIASYYDQALICRNGHVANSAASGFPHSTKYCENCSARTVSTCESCHQPIRGRCRIDGLVSTPLT